VDALGELTSPAGVSVSLKYAEHVPGLGGPSAKRVIFIQFKYILSFTCEHNARQNTLVQALEELGK
jgi:hypothetical protein